MSGSWLAGVGPLARRSIVRILRRPPVMVTGLLFPLILFGFIDGGLGGIAPQLPGFPTTSYTTFALALTFAYCGIYATTVAGAQLGEDIQTGYVRRVSMTSLSGVTLMLGLLAGTILFAIFQACVLLAIGLALGAHVQAGVGGALAIVALVALFALAFGSMGMVLALRTGSGHAVQGLFPLLMALFFLSSISLPRDILRAGWFRTVADFNPITYVIEAPRSLLVLGWNARALELGIAIAGSIAVTAILSAAASLRAQSVSR
jgi:ABC-2 type transport system permease protein